MASSGRGSQRPRCADLRRSELSPVDDQRPNYLQRGNCTFFRLADLIKCSDDDLEYLHPEWTDRAVETFIETYSPQLCVYTQGADGLRASTKFGVSAQVSAFLPGSPSDTVGAGDRSGHYFPKSIVWG